MSDLNNFTQAIPVRVRGLFRDKASVQTRADAFFNIHARGSSVAQEVRGGFVTFFAMAYIIVLNPIILASSADKFGTHLGVSWPSKSPRP